MFVESRPRSVVATAFEQYIRYGMSCLGQNEREIMRERFVTDPRMSSELSILAAQGVDSGPGGGYYVPDELMGPIVEAMKTTGGVRAVSTVITTRGGADLPIPTDNDTDVSGEIIEENATHSERDLQFGQVVMGSFLYSSKIVKVSRQFLADFRGDIAGYVGRKLGMRIGRMQNLHFTAGDGVSKPRGMTTASTAGKVAANAGSISYDDLADLQSSVDPAYQLASTWMMNFATLGSVRKLKDSANNPIWVPMSAAIPDTLLERPVQVNQDMDGTASGVRSVRYGDLSNYHVRDAGNVIVLRLEERYVERLQVGFLAFLRSDGDLVDAGTHPVKHLIHP